MLKALIKYELYDLLFIEKIGIEKMKFTEYEIVFKLFKN